jgi:hypothetical protein
MTAGGFGMKGPWIYTSFMSIIYLDGLSENMKNCCTDTNHKIYRYANLHLVTDRTSELYRIY